MDSDSRDNSRNMESKRERFVRIVERRVNNILDDFDSLGKCSNRKNYKYSDEDVKRIFGEIDNKIKEIKLLYRNSHERKRKFRLEP